MIQVMCVYPPKMKYSVLLNISIENFKLFYFSVNHQNIRFDWQYYIAQIILGDQDLQFCPQGEQGKLKVKLVPANDLGL